MGWKMDKKNDHIKDFLKGMKNHTKRFSVSLWTKDKDGDWDFPHAFTNLFVEASRLSAYHAGHIWMVQTVVTILVVGVMLWN